MAKKGKSAGNYAGKRVLWLACREAGYQLYRLLAKIFMRGGR